jgi:hypothetical protein
MSPILQHPLARIGAAVVVLAIVAVVVQHQMQTSTSTSWQTLASAEAGGSTVEALEDARAQAHDSPAGPWIDYQLAVKLFDRGEEGDFDRARQVAQEALARIPADHATRPWLEDLIAAIGSYPSAGTGS